MFTLITVFRRLETSLSWASRRALRPLRAALTRYRFERIVREHRHRRWAEIGIEIAAAKPGYVLLAGDSHAELMGHPAFSVTVINAGVGGIRAGAYAADLDLLPEPPQAGIAILLIGTNDTAWTLQPRKEWRIRAFEAAILNILAWLQAHASLVFVAAIPPVRPIIPGAHDLEAMNLYGQKLEDLCRSTGCHFVDPFSEVRADNAALLRPDILTDPSGTHLADYGIAITALAASVVKARSTT